MGMDFTLNDYDLYVANKVINGKQFTIVWYVGDNKISHEDPDVVSNIIGKLEGHSGKFTVTHGKEHEYLGMKIKFIEGGKVAINMTKQIK